VGDAQDNIPKSDNSPTVVIAEEEEEEEEEELEDPRLHPPTMLLSVGALDDDHHIGKGAHLRRSSSAIVDSADRIRRQANF
jgi:hypothetical protein